MRKGLFLNQKRLPGSLGKYILKCFFCGGRAGDLGQESPFENARGRFPLASKGRGLFLSHLSSVPNVHRATP